VFFEIFFQIIVLMGRAVTLFLLITSLSIWRIAMGSVSITTVSTHKVEIFYWVTIMFSQTLGTALGDWTSDPIGAGLGYHGAGLVFSSLLLIVAVAYYYTKISHTVLFWIAFILTRPLGAVLGDFLDKPLAAGGLNLSRYSVSAIIFVFMVICIMISKYYEQSKKISNNLQ
jgi:uncharacterized membrane-anchored protein